MPRTAKPTRCRDKWRIRWVDHEGVRRSAVYATHEEAERALRRRRTEAEEVKAGRRRRPAPLKTFRDLADYWLDHRAREKRSRKDDQSILVRHLLPLLGAKALKDIEVADIDQYKQEKRALPPKTVSNHLTLLGTMLRLAVELGWLHSMPAIEKPRVDPTREVDQPWLTEHQRDRLLAAAHASIDPMSAHANTPTGLGSPPTQDASAAGSS